MSPPAGEDPVREYTTEEQRTLTEHLLNITQAVHAGDLGKGLGSDAPCAWTGRKD